MILSRYILFFLPFASSQIIDIAVCSDNSCSKDCVNWRTNVGQCSVCVGGPNQCSVSNPSSVTTTNSLTLFSDSKCSTIIPSTANMPISLDNQCNKLQIGGSYRAQNISLVIGLSVASGVAFVIIVVCCCAWLCGCCRRKNTSVPPIPSTSNAIILDQSNMKVPDYFGNNPNGVQIYPPQQYEQPAYGQQYYPNNTYPQANYYPSQNYAQPVYGNQTYYTPTYQPYPATVAVQPYPPTVAIQPQPSAPPAPAYYDQGQRVAI